MSSTGKQSPLGMNVLGSLLQNTGFQINTEVSKYLGSSKTNDTYTPGSIVNDSSLKWLVYGINNAYNGYIATTTPSATVYNNLISIGSNSIPALGDSKPSTYVVSDPSGQWTGIANTGYYIAGTSNQGQEATWIPYDTTNPNVGITQWGFLRNYVLQAWSEYNWNGEPTFTTPVYKDFCSSFMTVKGFLDYNNIAVQASSNATNFQQGTFSTTTDMITADISGVNLALPEFGQDCINAGKAIDLSKIVGFGLPSFLLQNIKNNNAFTPSLALALLSSGLTNKEIDIISKNGTTGVTKKQEQQIYGAFLVIVGQDLIDILVPLNCKTPGLTSLADLLNIKSLFPVSYKSMTVPVYNISPGPTNSKTYYLIYKDGSANQDINTPAIQSQIGTIIIPGVPPVIDAIVSSNATNIQALSEGFGSYLDGILPPEIALTTGAFAYAMQQVKNIQQAPFEKFAQVVVSLETTKGLTMLSNNAVPANAALANVVSSTTGLGSGPNGQYTTSDFFGCMSGLPYLWDDIYKGVTSLNTTTLTTIYQKLFLCVSWLGATATVNYSTYSSPDGGGGYNWYYLITGLTLVSGGGGYSRGGAGAPTVNITGGSGATAYTTIGSNPSDLPGNFGKVATIVLSSAGSPVMYAASQVSPTPGVVPSPPIAEIQCPPTSLGGGTNTAYGTAGWPGMNTISQSLIDDANNEIAAIQLAHPSQASELNTAYNAAGTQLTIEQRARYIGIPAVPSPNRDDQLNASPTSLSIFVDAIPDFGKDTKPHMFSQTLEAISNLSLLGGQSVIGLMRESRNQARLEEIGIPIDDNLSGSLTDSQNSLLISNGTIQLAPPGVGVNGFTMPSVLVNDGVAPNPRGFFDNLTNQYYTNNCASELNSVSPLTDIMSSTGECTCAEEQVKAGARIPCPNGEPLDIGAGYPGSLAGSPYINTVPPNLNGAYISATILPSSYNVPEAIDQVTKNNNPSILVT